MTIRGIPSARPAVIDPFRKSLRLSGFIVFLNAATSEDRRQGACAHREEYLPRYVCGRSVAISPFAILGGSLDPSETVSYILSREILVPCLCPARPYCLGTRRR